MTTRMKNSAPLLEAKGVSNSIKFLPLRMFLNSIKAFIVQDHNLTRPQIQQRIFGVLPTTKCLRDDVTVQS